MRPTPSITATDQQRLPRPARPVRRIPPVFVIIPTYNEAENLPVLCRKIREVSDQYHVLVVDDRSPDGTGDMADNLARNDPQVAVVHRERKSGYASALRSGMAAALSRDAEIVVTMDADLSHEPSSIPALVEAVQTYDIAIGSRYVPGGKTQNWPIYRSTLSRTGNWFVRYLLGIGIHDCTSGFRAYRATAIRRGELLSTDSVGYAFGLESLHRCLLAGGRVTEVPIVFANRVAGRSKLSGRIIGETLTWALRQRRRASRL